jgi:hypothetical protein
MVIVPGQYIYTRNNNALSKYRVFQKELYNFESLYKFIQRAYTVFRTVIM